MKMIPILFSTPMVVALNTGTKDVTRRTRGLDEINENPDDWEFEGYNETLMHPFVFIRKSDGQRFYFNSPYGKQGDALWVRETWTQNGLEYYRYKADWPEGKGTFINKSVPEKFRGKWKPNIHMPYKACRKWLEVVSVRPERLHDITDEDIVREGVRYPVSRTGTVLFRLGVENSALSFMPEGLKAKDGPQITEEMVMRAHWAELWCEVNSRASWDSNPWVWRVEFKEIEKPEGGK